ncbi:MAG: hypothetical protein ACO3M5_03755 [Saprospiraceae bacterium]
MCNSLGTDKLISEELLNQLSMEGQYEVNYKAEMGLRAKAEKLKLFSLQKSVSKVHE